MPIHVLTIPWNSKQELFDNELLKEFQLKKRVLSYKAEFFSYGAKPYWTIILDYEELLKSEPQPELTPEEKIIFNKLRVWRREEAEKQGVSVYIILNNSVLKTISQKRPSQLAELSEIHGMGKKKVERYGPRILNLIQAIEKKP